MDVPDHIKSLIDLDGEVAIQHLIDSMVNSDIDELEKMVAHVVSVHSVSLPLTFRRCGEILANTIRMSGRRWDMVYSMGMEGHEGRLPMEAHQLVKAANQYNADGTSVLALLHPVLLSGDKELIQTWLIWSFSLAFLTADAWSRVQFSTHLN